MGACVAAILLTVAFDCLGQTDDKEAQTKSGYVAELGFGGPTSVNEQLREDDEVKEPAVRFPEIDAFLKPWFDWKRRVNDDYGLRLGVDYNALYQRASETLTGERQAASGAFRIFGNWTLIGRGTQDTGSLVFKVENRHTLGTDIAPTALGFAVGYNGITGTLFSDVGTVLVDLNWQQAFNDGRGGLIVGRYDPNDYVDVSGHANPWTTFSNLSVLVNTSIALPDAAYGIGGGYWLGGSTGEWYALGSVSDANGTIDNLDFFSGGSEFYATAEVGWTPTRAQRYTNQAHVTLWHVDAREDAGIPESKGVAVTANWTFEEKWMPFFRAGWSDGDAPLMNRTVTLGFLRRFHKSDLFGLGFNWGDPSDGTLRDQYSTELFYRFQFSENLAFTPSVQWLVDPALNPTEDQIWVVGIRGRISF